MNENLGNSFPKPNQAQKNWQDAELGLVYHYDLHIFDNERYSQGQMQKAYRKFDDPDLFNPEQLDTDQWIEGAKNCGAKLAIITASHETGFRLWQSGACPFSVKSTKWGAGKRDVVDEFVKSCNRAGILPGIYLSARWHSYYGIQSFRITDKSPVTQEQYNRMIEQEVEELCTRYGSLFELWFDGGILSPDKGGPDVLPIFEKYQPTCLFYHSDQRRDARWGGTESGTVGYPCWSTINLEEITTHREWGKELQQILMHGDPHGKDWCPAMSDAPLRNHEWFWEPDDEKKLYSLDELINMYYKSVGQNSTLILGATPGSNGLMPEADMILLKNFGNELHRRFNKPIAETSGVGEILESPLPSPQKINHVVIMEDISQGERIRRYEIEGLVAGNRWQKLCEGSCIGHKRIEQLAPVEIARIRLKVAESIAKPIIHNLTVFGN